MAKKFKFVSLFIPCLIDQVMPEIGLAMVAVLQKLGYSINYDSRQTCCGQPAFNGGHHNEARRVARHFIEVFSGAEAIVSPSGSCTGMVRNYFPLLFGNDQTAMREVEKLQNKTWEISEFICRENCLSQINGRAKKCIAFHNSCHSMCELGLSDETERILSRIEGVEIFTPKVEHSCCGFGGLFSFKMPEVAVAMAKSRLQVFAGAGLDYLIANDPGCIQHLRAEAKATGFKPQILHFVEFLKIVMF